MKSIVKIILLLTAVLIVACGAEQQPAVEDQSADGIENVEIVEEIQEIAPLYPEGTLNPALVTAEVPVSGADLFSAFYAWDGQTVVIQGYPFVHYGDSITIEDDLELVTIAGERDKLVKVTFTDPLNLRIAANEPITVSGTIDYSWTGRIELVEGVIVTDAVLISAEEVSPYFYNGISAIEVQDFFDIFNVWIGMEVTVEGYYSSTTTSSLASGDVVRIDLTDPETNSKCIACEMETAVSDETSATMISNRDNTQIRGVIEGESFNIVGLVNCELVNR